MEKDGRDPKTLGEALLDMKKLNPHLTLSEIADGKSLKLTVRSKAA